MALDGVFLNLLAGELAEAVDARIEKIYQPQRDVLVFLLRRAGFHKKLLFSLRPGSARVQFTELDFANPDTPPMLCMLLRKTLCGGRILSFATDGFERVLYLTVEAADEMGDRVTYRVVCELIGSKSNLILVNPAGRIVDAVRRSDVESGARMIQPGAAYTPPERQQKHDLLAEPLPALADTILAYKGDAVAAVQNTLDGISPLIAREIVHRAGAAESGFFAPENRGALLSTLLMLKDMVLKGGAPTPLLREGVPADFTYLPVLQYGTKMAAKTVDSYSNLLDRFYKEKAESESKAELDRFVEVMECIWSEIKEVEEGKASKEDNVLKNAPHPEYEVTADEWKHAYPRTKAAFPLEWLHDSKFWINVARVDNAYGDRNLIPTLCACEI